jgi:hypothetical protein
MTDRGLPIVDGAPACPFVAFDDDRDERAASPDHRHRCYAEARPAPRALAHQEAYCLSSAFPVCPTFQDWARREAARSRADKEREAESDAAAGASDLPRRNPPRNWSAPPPWSSNRGEGGEDDDEDDWQGAAGAAIGAAGADIPRRGRGLSGSFADRVAAGAADAELGEHEADEEPPVANGRSPGPLDLGPARHRERESGQLAAFEDGGGERGAPPPPRHERRRDADAPEWERARPLEVYPTLRARRLPELSLPPLLVAVVAIALAAAVLFALPGILGFGSPSAISSPSPSPGASTAAETSAPTLVPAPTPVIYIVRSGDTMSKIANKFHVPLDDLIAANAETIPDPDTLQIGDQVIIPVAQPSQLPAASEAPASG